LAGSSDCISSGRKLTADPQRTFRDDVCCRLTAVRQTLQDPDGTGLQTQGVEAGAILTAQHPR